MAGFRASAFVLAAKQSVTLVTKLRENSFEWNGVEFSPAASPPKTAMASEQQWE